MEPFKVALPQALLERYTTLAEMGKETLFQAVITGLQSV